MHVFLAGATGVIGRALVPLLLQAGHQVTGTSRTTRGAARLGAAGATGIALDVFDREAVTDALLTTAPDALIHQLTALGDGSPADNARIRRDGTRNLVDAARKAGVGRIVAQSIAWAYEAGDLPADESVPLDLSAPPPRATTIGGIHALETAAAEISDHVILRYGTLYGPDTWYAPQGLIAARLRAGELLANDAVTSFVHVQDAAQAALLALTWPNGPINIVDHEPAPARAWLPALATALDEPAPAPGHGRAGWERGARNHKATALGWQPRHPSWRTGFHQQK
ncbi:NAD-dependent epimerase/dehydratase family protein [Actinomadura opuntiae]|uniref:NAD-dependent epimerase/dehydratase family protein n=1 Tax=Actinomadura sp. OS1-43 TaxID=604315 RepID=UPI00255A76F3|nr:NAD(P)-dependent oxidoreductase [Actinomadura sp. OS1-43]MDL4814042.1 NAD(P)-dependent oxidoreductase [Actinomadura sp. OS1-43]